MYKPIVYNVFEPFFMCQQFCFYNCSPYFQREMAARETDVGKATAVEGYSEEQYGSYVNNLCGSLAAMSTSVQGYEYKRRLLQLGIDLEISAAEAIRGCNQFTVTAGAKDNDLTVARKAAMLEKLGEKLFRARKLVLFARIAALDGFQAASNVSLKIKCCIC